MKEEQITKKEPRCLIHNPQVPYAGYVCASCSTTGRAYYIKCAFCIGDMVGINFHVKARDPGYEQELIANFCKKHRKNMKEFPEKFTN